MYNQRGSCEDPKYIKIPSSNSGFPRMVFSNGGTLKFHGLLCFIIIFPIFNRASQRVMSWVRLPGTPW